jgi:hypothetical protein
MKRTFTQTTNRLLTKGEGIALLEPSKEALQFITQFARAYCCLDPQKRLALLLN